MPAIAISPPPVLDRVVLQTQPLPEVPCQTMPSQTSCRDTVRKLVASLSPQRSTIERRGDRRFPFPYLVRLVAVDESAAAQAADNDASDTTSLTVIGKHLSETGLGFYHQQPLPYRRVHVWLGSPTGIEVQMLMDLSWCRFVGQGWYVSGGRFIEAVQE
jgi:hypothetical protein